MLQKCQKQCGSLTKKRKTYSEEEINTMISQQVQAALKARESDPKQTDESDAESVNMEKFNHDPTSDSELECHEVLGKDIEKTCKDNKSVKLESYKNFKMLDAILNRCLASPTCTELEKTTIPVLYAWIHTYKDQSQMQKQLRCFLIAVPVQHLYKVC